VSVHLEQLRSAQFLLLYNAAVYSIFSEMRSETQRKVELAEKELEERDKLIPHTVRHFLRKRITLWKSKTLANSRRRKSLPHLEVEELDTEPLVMDTEADLLELDCLLRMSVAKQFNTNVLRVALANKEEAVASVLVAFYEVALDDEILNLAISKDMFNCLCK